MNMTQDDMNVIHIDTWPQMDPPCDACKSPDHGHLVVGQHDIMCPVVAEAAAAKFNKKHQRRDLMITITVEGPAKAGKTAAAAYIAEVLSRLGANTSLRDIDIDTEEKQIAAVARSRHVLAGAEIRVVTKQQKLTPEPTDDELGVMGG